MVAAMSIRDRVASLIDRLATERQFPTQGETIFVDLERRGIERAFIPRRVVETFLGGRGVNMFLLHNLLDPSLHPLHPDVPLIFGTGILTSLVPSAARGNATSWSPETNAIDHLVLFGKSPSWTVLHFGPRVIPSAAEREGSPAQVRGGSFAVSAAQ